jgi:UDPglucose 6-dehydrogenase
MNVCVQGLWHIGTVTAACMASLRNRVVGLDFNAETIVNLKRGVLPLFEPGLDALVKQGMASGQLSFSSDPEGAAMGCEVLWVTYDTPVDDDDNADIDYVVGQIEKILPHLPAGATVLISSQMPVGSVKRLEAVANARFAKKNFGFACSPENLRLGKALQVFLKPDRIVVGVRSLRDRERLDRLLRPIAARIEWMSVESAEMTKHAINAFLATSVAFANEIASLCEMAGADAKEVERGLKTESRIGPGGPSGSGPGVNVCPM